MRISEYSDAVLSYGGGVNSTALAILLVNAGWRGEIVFADTGAEWPDTYCFMDYFETGWLEPKGLKTIRLQGLPWQRYGGGVGEPGCSLIRYCELRRMIPFASLRWCTVEWKVKPLDRWANGKIYMIGISAEEAHRQPDQIRPLVDWGVDRNECVKIIQGESLNVPRKSGCWICPFQRSSQWRELWERYPELYERAVFLEENAKRRKGRKGPDPALDPRGITLRQRLLAYQGQMNLPGLDMDSLQRYQPCICGL